MTLPSYTVANQKVVLLKHYKKDNKSYFYGPFINTTPAGAYPVSQDLQIHNEKLSFNWPSSEQAYHAQKIIHLKKKLAATDPRQAALTQALFKIQNAVGPNQVFLPQNYVSIVEELVNRNRPALGANKGEFDALCDANFHSVKAPQQGINPTTGKPFTLDFMRTVLRLKLEQNSELKTICMQLAREGLLPIEVSRLDQNWASGPQGKGLNMLGTLILEEGNRLLIANGETPAITNPVLCYQELQGRAGAQLGHDVLEPQQKLMIENKAGPAAAGSPVLPQQNQGHYEYNNPNPNLATKAVYYDAQGTRSRGFYKLNINADWIEATSFKKFDINQFPEQRNSQVQGTPDQIPVSVPNNPSDADQNEQLIQHLRMDVDNQANLSYWSKQVFIGGCRYKGKLIPHSVAKVLDYIQENKQLPYAEFKQGIEQILKEKSNSFSEQLGLSGLFRSKAVKDLREKAETNHIEQFNPK